MKRIFLFLVSVLAFGRSLPAADFSLSAGAGGLLGGVFTRYEASSGSGTMTQNVNQFNYGGLVFFDAAYAELSVFIQGGMGNYDEKMYLSSVSIIDPVKMNGDGWETVLGFSLLGKYPFTLAPRFKLFPLLGMDFKLALKELRRENGDIIRDRTDGGQKDKDKDGKPYDISVWNSFWVNVGVGADFYIIKNLFLRGELLYSFRLMTDYEADGLEQMKDVLHDDSPSLGGLTSGPSLRFCVGYRLW